MQLWAVAIASAIVLVASISESCVDQDCSAVGSALLQKTVHKPALEYVGEEEDVESQDAEVEEDEEAGGVEEPANKFKSLEEEDKNAEIEDVDEETKSKQFDGIYAASFPMHSTVTSGTAAVLLQGVELEDALLPRKELSFEVAVLGDCTRRANKQEDGETDEPICEVQVNDESGQKFALFFDDPVEKGQCMRLMGSPPEGDSLRVWKADQVTLCKDTLLVARVDEALGTPSFQQAASQIEHALQRMGKHATVAFRGKAANDMHALIEAKGYLPFWATSPFSHRRYTRDSLGLLFGYRATPSKVEQRMHRISSDLRS